jgi:hypothetical protein
MKEVLSRGVYVESQKDLAHWVRSRQFLANVSPNGKASILKLTTVGSNPTTNKMQSRTRKCVKMA